MKAQKNEIVASIDVGTNFLRMLVAEITPEAQLLALEDLFQPTQIGRDTFSHGRIGAASLNQACDVLRGFSQIMKDYRVRHHRAVATSGIRESDNREHVLDLIRLRTGLSVAVLNHAQERFYHYKSLRNALPDVLGMRQEGLMIMHIGMGGVEVSIYTGGSLRFTQYVMIGSLRLREILAELESQTLDFPKIIEQFIESKSYLLESEIRQPGVRNVIGLGSELAVVASLCRNRKWTLDPHYLSRSALAELHRDVRHKTSEQIQRDFSLHRNEAEILLPTVITLCHFLNLTNADGVHVPSVSLRQGLLEDMVDDRFLTQRRQDFLQDIVTSACYFAKKFGSDRAHAAHVEKLALSIFDQSTRLHGMGERERLFLQVAAILHDIGKHININHHDQHSYTIINSQDIMGFSDREVAVVANVARYHSEESPSSSHGNYRQLADGDKVLVTKLAAMLRLADALDITHRQLVESVDLAVSGRELHIRLATQADILLEEWNFLNRCQLFEEVIGYRPILKRKR